MNGQYIGIGPKKAISVDPLHKMLYSCQWMAHKA